MDRDSGYPLSEVGCTSTSSSDVNLSAAAYPRTKKKWQKSSSDFFKTVTQKISYSSWSSSLSRLLAASSSKPLWKLSLCLKDALSRDLRLRLEELPVMVDSYRRILLHSRCINGGGWQWTLWRVRLYRKKARTNAFTTWIQKFRSVLAFVVSSETARVVFSKTLGSDRVSTKPICKEIGKTKVETKTKTYWSQRIFSKINIHEMSQVTQKWLCSARKQPAAWAVKNQSRIHWKRAQLQQKNISESPQPKAKTQRAQFALAGNKCRARVRMTVISPMARAICI